MIVLKTGDGNEDGRGLFFVRETRNKGSGSWQSSCLPDHACNTLVVPRVFFCMCWCMFCCISEATHVGAAWPCSVSPQERARRSSCVQSKEVMGKNAMQLRNWGHTQNADALSSFRRFARLLPALDYQTAPRNQFAQLKDSEISPVRGILSER